MFLQNLIRFHLKFLQNTKIFLNKVSAHKKFDNDYKAWMSLSIGADLNKLDSATDLINDPESKSLVPKRLQVQEVVRRYQNIDSILSNVISKKTSV